MQGHLDFIRTPIYPLFLGGTKLIFGEGRYLFVAIILQHLLFIFSIWPFYRTINYLSSSKVVVYSGTLFYACFPFFNTWANRILTESLAITLSVVLIFIVTRWMSQYSSKKSSNVKIGVLFGIILLLLQLLRPIFIYMLPIFLFLFAFMLFRRKKVRLALSGLISTLVVCLLMILYMSEFKREYGVFATNGVQQYNQALIAKDQGLISYDDVSTYSAPLISEESQDIENVMKEYSSSFLDGIFSRFSLSASEALNSSYYARYLSWMNIGYIYLFLLLYLVILLAHMIMKRQIHWISVLIFALCVSNIIVAILGAPSGEYSRLFRPSMPFILLMLGQLLSPIHRDTIEHIDFK